MNEKNRQFSFFDSKGCANKENVDLGSKMRRQNLAHARNSGLDTD